MNIHSIQFDELLFLKKFKEDDLSSFKDYFSSLSNLDFICLLDKNYLLYAVLHFSDYVKCSAFYSIENRSPLNKENLISEDSFLPNDILSLFTDIDHLIEEKENIINKEAFNKKKESIIQKSVQPTQFVKKDIHTDTQFIIKSIADIVSYKCWVAKNDKSRKTHGNELGLSTLRTFPNFNVPKNVLNVFKLIDCIWFENERPVSCFEVETSTSIYSAFLRFADLDLSLPLYDIDYFVLIPKKRLNKVLHEFSRPSIQSLTIANKTKIIFIEDIEILFQKINGLHGFISPNILEKISYNIIDLEFVKENSDNTLEV